MACVFVYGTLRNGEVRHEVLQNCEFLGLAYAEGYDLYLISDYPGMVPALAGWLERFIGFLKTYSKGWIG